MKIITVDKNNIDKFSPYQGVKKKLSIGNKLYIIKSDVPCVIHIPGRAYTFSIVSDKTLQTNRNLNYKFPDDWYAYNIWSINNKFINLKS